MAQALYMNGSEIHREIRQTIETHGGFIEDHVATPIEVCEQRDKKGMYAKAKAGLIKGFTSVDDLYETLEAPEMGIDTTQCGPDEAAQEILLHLGRQGYIQQIHRSQFEFHFFQTATPTI